MYELTLTRKAQKFYEQAELSLVERLNRCFEQLRENPYEHPNIKSLKGTFAGCFRYRVGDWRIIYRIDEENKIIIILLVVHRSEAYR